MIHESFVKIAAGYKYGLPKFLRSIIHNLLRRVHACQIRSKSVNWSRTGSILLRSRSIGIAGPDIYSIPALILHYRKKTRRYSDLQKSDKSSCTPQYPPKLGLFCHQGSEISTSGKLWQNSVTPSGATIHSPAHISRNPSFAIVKFAQSIIIQPTHEPLQNPPSDDEFLFLLHRRHKNSPRSSCRSATSPLHARASLYQTVDIANSRSGMRRSIASSTPRALCSASEPSPRPLTAQHLRR